MSDHLSSGEGEEQSPPDQGFVTPRSGGERLPDDQPGSSTVTEDHVMTDTGFEPENEMMEAGVENENENETKNEVEDIPEVVMGEGKATLARLNDLPELIAIDGSASPSNQLRPASQVSPTMNGTSPEALKALPTSVEEDKDIALLSELLQNTTPEVAQKLLRDNWRIFLFSKSSATHDFPHLTFVLRAGLKNAPPLVVKEVINLGGFYTPDAVQHLGKKKEVVKAVMNSASPTQLKDLVPPPILHQVLIDHLDRVGGDALQHVIAGHIKKMPAKQLVRMLADANRLGYKSTDIIDYDDETVIPNIPAAAAANQIQAAEASQSQHYSPAIPPNHIHPPPNHQPPNHYNPPPHPSQYNAHPPQNHYNPHPPQAHYSPVVQTPVMQTPVPPPPVQNHRNLASANSDPLLAEQERNAALLRQEQAITKSASKVRLNAPVGRNCPYCSVVLPTDPGYHFVSRSWSIITHSNKYPSILKRRCV